MQLFTEQSDLTSCYKFIDSFKDIITEKRDIITDEGKVIQVLPPSDDPSILSKLKKIKLHASMPFCTEQVLNILIEIFNLKYSSSKIDKINEFALNNPEHISIFAKAIPPLLRSEQHDLAELKEAVQKFCVLSGDEKAFFETIKNIRNNHFSCIDIDSVMHTASRTQKSSEIAGKNAIVVVGPTGAGKSFLINYICCEEMFSRSMFGNKLIVNEKKQPKYLQHIRIGNGARSATSKMLLVDISKTTSAWMKTNFHNKNYVICDTPGAGDTRQGHEIKLANSLETIMPLSTASTVRFLVVIPAENKDRGMNFKKSIQFVARMFDSPEQLELSASSIIFAINYEANQDKIELLEDYLKDFIADSKEFQLNDNDITLTKILQKKFSSNEVILIQPEGKNPVKPEALMEKLDKCPGVKPTILTPAPEAEIKELVSLELSLITKSIEKIFESLEADITHETIQTQIQRLLKKLAKLNFMKTYFPSSEVDILIHLQKLAKLLGKLQENALLIFTPEKDALNQESIPAGKKILERIQKLDQMIKIMTNGFISNNREFIISLIKIFDDTVKTPDTFEEMNPGEWFEWIEKNRPQSHQKIGFKVKAHRVKLAHRLEDLINLKLNRIKLHQIKILVALKNTKTPKISHAHITEFDNNNSLLNNYITSNLSEANVSALNLEQYMSDREKALTASINYYERDPEIILSEVVNSLNIQNQQLSDLLSNEEGAPASFPANQIASPTVEAPAPSAPEISNENNAVEVSTLSPNILQQYFDLTILKLAEHGVKASICHDFVTAINTIDTMRQFAILFGCSCEEIVDVQNNFIESFKFFVAETKAFVINGNQPFNDNTIQEILFNFILIANARKLENFSRYTSSTMYMSEAQLALESLETELSSRFQASKLIINGICEQKYTAKTFAEIDSQLQQLWYLLSLPCEEHTRFVSEYAEIVSRVRQSCIRVSGEFSGRLESSESFDQVSYRQIKGYLDQLNALPMIEVLNLDQAKQNLKEALEQRAETLVNKVNQVDLSLDSADKLVTIRDLVNETKHFGETFFSDLSPEILKNIQTTLEEQNNKITSTIKEIDSCIADLRKNLDLEIPIDTIVKINNYLNNCQKIDVFQREVKDLKKDLQDYIKEYTAAKKSAANNLLDSLQPTSTSDMAVPVQMVATLISQYKQLKENVPELYQLCDDPIQAWANNLHTLALKYHQALTDALQLAASNIPSNQEILIKRVNQFQAFDPYIKQYISGENRLSFKKLFTRFENAFKTEHFVQLKGVMSCIFAGDFEAAKQSVSDNRNLGPDTDMRAVLVDQIETCMLASMTGIERNIEQLKLNQAAAPAFMDEFTQNYKRISSAKILVEAKLLTGQLSARRENLLSNTQLALDIWLSAIIKKIDNYIENLDFKSAYSEISDLETTLESMPCKPNNDKHVISGVKKRFHDKPIKCFGQYKQDFTLWKKNSYSLANIATAFSAVKDLPYDSKTYGDYWAEISAHIYQTLDNKCSEIEKEFHDNRIDASTAITIVEEIAIVIQNVPAEATDLPVRVKERYQNTVAQIQQSMIEEKREDIRDNNIQYLLNQSDRFARTIGALDFTKAKNYLNQKALNLKAPILEAINKGVVPFSDLVSFARLYQQFGNRAAAFQQDHQLYADMLNALIERLSAEITNGHSLYITGTNQENALYQIHLALVQLIEVQNLSKATNTMANLVDKHLPKKIIPLLKDVKNLLESNKTKFDTALITRNLVDLDDALGIALTFQDITLDIERYINACPDKSTLSPDLAEEYEVLQQLNSKFSYVRLRDLLTAELKSIRSALDKLDPSTLTEEGKTYREDFYTKLRINIEFIQKMSDLNKHIDDQVLKDKNIASDYGLKQCLDAVSLFLEKTFRAAYHQLQTVSTPSVDHNWSDFNRYYQELSIFIDKCSSVACLANLKLSKNMDGREAVDNNESVEACLLAKFFKEQFNSYLTTTINDFKKKFENLTLNDTDEQLVELLSGLQKMLEDMTVVAAEIKSTLKIFLKDISQLRPSGYISFLAVQLSNESSGFGARMIAEQDIFTGEMIAQRNALTQSQDIHYVLKHIEIQDKKTGCIRSLYNHESEYLLAQYNKFAQVYDQLINEHIAEQKNFAVFSNIQLDELKNRFLKVIEKSELDTNNISWDNRVTQIIPELYAYLFAIWTLNESRAFFDSEPELRNRNFLKKPSPAQIIAIFQMLNVMDAGKEGLPSMLNEVLTGEGKSVVLACTAAVLASLGFAVDIGCYSEYLSGRDEADFKWLMAFLGIEKFVQYGTFNRLSEDMLNREGDLRHLLENALFGKEIPIVVKERLIREKTALVDEVDSLVTAFFGHMYQPYFLLKEDLVEKLLNAIWSAHENGAMIKLQRLREYRACFEHYEQFGLGYIIQHAAKEMLDDLSKYKREQGHDFYVNSKGEIYYKHFDGATMSKSIGYRTYWACRDKANNISESCRKKHEGIKITCGAFSYAELMGDTTYRNILGLTGTYRELSKAENSVVKEVFGIKNSSFIPSAYGKNNLQFSSGTDVFVVPDDEYYTKLFTETARSKVGQNGEAIRPVIIFFKTEEELEAFYRSDVLKGYRKTINKMSSRTISTNEERNKAIRQAARPNTITLATEEYGRGNDYILTHPGAIGQGGLTAMDAYMPETAAEQRQHMGRAARQGQPGSYKMVIKESEIMDKFGFTKEQIDTARKAGNLYDMITTARDTKFSEAYQELIDDSAELSEKIHKPSIELLNILRNPKSTREEIIAAHKKTIPGAEKPAVEVKFKNAKVLLLFDSTGSMGSLIGALKDTLYEVVEGLSTVLKDEINATFELQIAHYEDYYSGPEQAFRHTKQWSCDPKELKDFIRNVEASGGGSNSSECVETGLWYANTLTDLDHVLLFGDEPPTPTQNEIMLLRADENNQKKAPHIKTGAFFEARHYVIECQDLATKHVPVSTFFINAGHGLSGIAEQSFKDIAQLTNGEAMTLDLSPGKEKAAQQQITDLFARKIIGAVVEDSNDNNLADDLFEKVKARIQQFRN